MQRARGKRQGAGKFANERVCELTGHSPLADYALDLLSPIERRRVEAHTAVCMTCRAALQQERAVGTAVRQTLQAAAQPSSVRLRQLMPAPPRRTIPFWQAWQKQLAVAALVLVLLAGGLSLFPAEETAVWPAATALSATATMTPTSTATLAAKEPLLTATPIAAAPAKPAPRNGKPIIDVFVRVSPEKNDE